MTCLVSPGEETQIMGLVIHDLKNEEWEKIKADYEGWTVISDNGTIRPCIGCFSCWDRTPGQCVIKDGYDMMGSLIHHADEVTVISRLTWGGFSGFVKNVFDRSLGYVLPQLGPVGGESHHLKRYDEDKPVTFIFYGEGITDEQKSAAVRYVTAVCTNLRGSVKEVIFRETGEQADIPETRPEPAKTGRTVLLVGSMRGENAHSYRLAKKLRERLTGDAEIVMLSRYTGRTDELLDELQDAPSLVLCLPLYVDGLPSQVIRLMERYRCRHGVTGKRIYVLANMGLYEPEQLVNLFASAREWCRDMGFRYCGSLAVGAGEVVGKLIDHLPFRIGPARNAAIGVERLAEAINGCSETEDIFKEPFMFPKKLYFAIANKSWDLNAREHGLRPEDLYRRL